MKKVFFVVVLAIALLVTACAAPTAEPTKAPAPTSAPAAATSAPAAATSAPAATKATPHPEVKINIYTSSFGTASYTAAFALGDLINKKHPWLKVAVQETTQAADAIKTVAADPALRKNSIFPLASSLHYDAVNGTGSFKGAPIKYQALAMYNSNTVGFVALDPKIQTMNDLNGKRLTIGSAGGAAPTFQSILDAYGIKPSKVEMVSWDPGKDELIDGRTDAAAQTFGDTNLTPFTPNATITQLIAQSGFHVIPMDPTMIKKAAETVLLGPQDLPAGILNLTKPTTVAVNTNTFSVMPEFDPEVAYEVTKFIAENAAAFQDYDKSLASVKKSTLGAVSVPFVTVHPGAEKYFKEAGIKIGQ